MRGNFVVRTSSEERRRSILPASIAATSVLPNGRTRVAGGEPLPPRLQKSCSRVARNLLQAFGRIPEETGRDCGRVPQKVPGKEVGQRLRRERDALRLPKSLLPESREERKPRLAVYLYLSVIYI